MGCLTNPAVLYLELFFTFFASEVPGGLAVGGGLLLLAVDRGRKGAVRDEGRPGGSGVSALYLRVEWLVLVLLLGGGDEVVGLGREIEGDRD